MANYDNYDVGYGRPPREHQFKKGVSGNPKGRPRGAKTQTERRSFDEFVNVILKESSRSVTVREGEERHELSMFEAAVRQLGMKAVRGDNRAIKMFLELQQRATALRREEVQEQIAFVEHYKKEWGPVFARAEQNGEPEPDHLPHPDHVNISNETGLLEVTGPLNPEQKKAWETHKDQLRVFETFADGLEKDLAEGDDEALPILRKVRRKIRKLEKMIPPGWNWREGKAQDLLDLLTDSLAPPSSAP